VIIKFSSATWQPCAETKKKKKKKKKKKQEPKKTKKDERDKKRQIAIKEKKGRKIDVRE
jgi:hypothetical protein